MSRKIEVVNKIMILNYRNYYILKNRFPLHVSNLDNNNSNNNNIKIIILKYLNRELFYQLETSLDTTS